jgi:hypothetical protein
MRVSRHYIGGAVVHGQQCRDNVKRIAELEVERDIFKRTLDKRDAENERLRKAIEDAPHAPDCYSNPLGKCDCWKQEALKHGY